MFDGLSLCVISCDACAPCFLNICLSHLKPLKTFVHPASWYMTQLPLNERGGLKWCCPSTSCERNRHICNPLTPLIHHTQDPSPVSYYAMNTYPASLKSRKQNLSAMACSAKASSRSTSGSRHFVRRKLSIADTHWWLAFASWRRSTTPVDASLHSAANIF